MIKWEMIYENVHILDPIKTEIGELSVKCKKGTEIWNNHDSVHETEQMI